MKMLSILVLSFFAASTVRAECAHDAHASSPKTVEEALRKFFASEKPAVAETTVATTSKLESPVLAINVEKVVEQKTETPKLAPVERASASVTTAQEKPSLVSELSKIMTTEESGSGFAITIDEKTFEPASYTVTQESRHKLAAIGQLLAQHPEHAFLVEGYTADDQNDERNEVLSVRRTHAVRNILVEAGVAKSRFKTFGFGSRFPASVKNPGQRFLIFVKTAH